MPADTTADPRMTQRHHEFLAESLPALMRARQNADDRQCHRPVYVLLDLDDAKGAAVGAEWSGLDAITAFKLQRPRVAGRATSCSWVDVDSPRYQETIVRSFPELTEAVQGPREPKELVVVVVTANCASIARMSPHRKEWS